MKNKKGFTIVELVIVIAVIAILAGVLIPTFSGVVEKANLSAAYQNARNEYSMYVAYCAETGDAIQDGYVQVIKGNKEYWFEIKDGALNSNKETSKPSNLANQDLADLSEKQVKSVTIVTPAALSTYTGTTKYYTTANCAGDNEIKAQTASTTKDQAYNLGTPAKLVAKNVELTAAVNYASNEYVTLSSKNYLLSQVDTADTETDGYTQVGSKWYKLKDNAQELTSLVKTAATYEWQIQAGTYYYLENVTEAFGNADVKIYAVK